jgi:hypothetical protein
VSSHLPVLAGWLAAATGACNIPPPATNRHEWNDPTTNHSYPRRSLKSQHDPPCTAHSGTGGTPPRAASNEHPPCISPSTTSSRVPLVCVACLRRASSTLPQCGATACHTATPLLSRQGCCRPGRPAPRNHRPMEIMAAHQILATAQHGESALVQHTVRYNTQGAHSHRWGSHSHDC